MEIAGKEYITGVFRGENGLKKVAHLYRGTFDEPGNPMCSRGWQRRWYDENGNLEDWEYSIFRNNTSEAGLCSICLKRALDGKLPVDSPPSKNRQPRKSTKD